MINRATLRKLHQLRNSEEKKLKRKTTFRKFAGGKPQSKLQNIPLEISDVGSLKRGLRVFKAWILFSAGMMQKMPSQQSRNRS